MKQENPASIKIHFIGIGGIGVSALAKIYHNLNAKVTGSDISQNEQTDELKTLNIPISIGHSEENIKNPDLVIYSLAIPKNNPELQKAKQNGIKTISYPQALGELTANYKLIAVAGSHGKTTTTGMLAKILIEAGLDPTIIIGSTVNFLQNENFRVGKSKYFLLEACEYHAGFLNFNPYITLITNLEHDHFDAFPTDQSYLDAFQKLINKSEFTVINTDFPLSKKLILPKNAIKYSQSNSKIPLGIPGIHNQTNAQGAIKVSEILKIPNPELSLSDFTGTKRRLEIIKQTQNQIIYDDYGHHPTEIKATLQALNEKHPGKSICLIYQPHQHNRSIALIDEFKDAFQGFQKVIIPDIYAARDTQDEKSNMTASNFATIIKAIYKPEIYESTEIFNQETKDFDIIVIMGAGNILTKIKERV